MKAHNQPVEGLQKHVLEMLAQDDFKDTGVSTLQLIVHFSMTQSALYRTIAELIEKQLICRGTKSDLFFVTDAGRAALSRN